MEDDPCMLPSPLCGIFLYLVDGSEWAGVGWGLEDDSLAKEKHSDLISGS